MRDHRQAAGHAGVSEAAPPPEGFEPRPAEPAAPPAGPSLVLRGPVQLPGEVDGPSGPEPTRYGDWERGGRCSDF
ncbi:MAG: DUF1674 domain-containing protein [Geminicoccaceae bacterium]|nr:DUF1674 domain-containing protein [Geminicoccaceae bacterium]